jgi:hypothetical protein
VGVFVPGTGCEDVVAGLVSTASAIACTVKSKSVPIGADGGMVEDTMNKPGKFCQCVKMFAPSPPICIGGLEFLTLTIVEVQKASTAVERTGVEESTPLVLAGVCGALASIVDGSIGAFPHTNPRIKICDVVMDILVEAPLKA